MGSAKPSEPESRDGWLPVSKAYKSIVLNSVKLQTPLTFTLWGAMDRGRQTPRCDVVNQEARCFKHFPSFRKQLPSSWGEQQQIYLSPIMVVIFCHQSIDFFFLFFFMVVLYSFPGKGVLTSSRIGSIRYLCQSWPWCLAKSVSPGPRSSLLFFANSWRGQWSCGLSVSQLGHCGFVCD